MKDPLAISSDVIAGRSGSTGSRTVSSFVAVGDSFTAGKGCAPGAAWTDRLASALGQVHRPLGYANLAADGATSVEVERQIGPALQREPDLVTLICGANDVLRSGRPDTGGYEERLARMFDQLRSGLPRVAILTATCPTSWRFMPLGPRTRARFADAVARLNQATRSVAASRGVACLEVADHPGLNEQRNFAADGLHPSAEGHRRAAVEIAHAIRDQFGIESAITWRERR